MQLSSYLLLGPCIGSHLGSGSTLPINTVAPVISGTPDVGETLSCTEGTWTVTGTPSYTYQWKRDGSSIGGATSATYVLTEDDALTQITCTVTATDDEGSTDATSNALDINEAPQEIIPVTELPGLVAFWDGKQYSGSGNWLNQVSGGSALDVTPTNTALHNGQNLWEMNNTAYFTGTNNTFMSNLHKTTGGQSFTWFARIRTPTSSINLDNLFGTASTSTNHGLEIRGDSSGIIKIDQYAGGSAVTKQSTAVTNRGFSSGSTGWTITGTGLSIPGTTTADWSASNGVLSQTLPTPIIQGTKYRVSYTVSNYSAGTITVSLGGTPGTARSANGTYTEDIVAGATDVLAFTGAGFTGSIDNADVRFAANEYYTLVITHDASTNQIGFSFGTDDLEVIADGWGATTTAPTYDFNLASDGNNQGLADSGVQIFGMGFIDHAITEAELTVLNTSLLDHFSPPVAVVPSQAIQVLGMAGHQAVYFNYHVVNDGGSPITDTLIETSADGSTGWSAVSDSSWGAARDVSVTGLTNGVAAYYRLTPINAIGSAASPSAVIGPLTPVAEGTNPYDEQYYKLTRPVNSSGLRSGSAVEVLQPALLTHYSANFGREDGKFYFQAQDGGAATATASSCRSEFRHLTNIAYTTATEDTLKFSVNCYDNGAGSYPASQKMTVHQIHDSDEPWVKIVYTAPSAQGGSNGQLRALVKATAGASDTVTTLKTGMSDGDITTLRIKYVINSQVGDLVTGELQFFLDGNNAGSTPDFTSPVSRNQAGLTYYWKRGIYPIPSGQVGWRFKATHYTQTGQYVP